MHETWGVGLLVVRTRVSHHHHLDLDRSIIDSYSFLIASVRDGEDRTRLCSPIFLVDTDAPLLLFIIWGIGEKYRGGWVLGATISIKNFAADERLPVSFTAHIQRKNGYGYYRRPIPGFKPVLTHSHVPSVSSRVIAVKNGSAKFVFVLQTITVLYGKNY